MPSGRPLSVCIFSKAYSAHRGGRFLWPFMLVARQLAAIGHRVTVITTRHPDGAKRPIARIEQEPGISIHYLGAGRPEKTDRAYWRESAKTFDRLHLEQPFDIVMGRGRSSSGFLQYSRHAGTIPLISHEGTYPAWLHPYKITRRRGIAGIFRHLARPIHAWLDARANRRHTACLTGSALVIANGAALADSIAETYWWRPPPARAIPYGFMADDFLSIAAKPRFPARVQELTDSGRRFVLYVGRVTRTKGALDLLHALHAAGQEDVSLLVVGPMKKKNRKRLIQLALSLGLARRLVLAGAVEHAFLPALLTRAEALLFPSLHPESLPKAVMEAMAAGLPVAGYRIPALAGMIDHGSEGFLAPPGDSAALGALLGRLLREPALAARMGHAARRRIDRDGHPGRVDRLWQEALESVLPPVASRERTGSIVEPRAALAVAS
ncbi:MAG: glycosyltransferase family 4 protein [Nitratireductor sp.]|nr:glycosyltransferase family 4 protein [Nitratireductor sp.]